MVCLVFVFLVDCQNLQEFYEIGEMAQLRGDEKKNSTDTKASGSSIVTVGGNKDSKGIGVIQAGIGVIEADSFSMEWE